MHFSEIFIMSSSQMKQLHAAAGCYCVHASPACTAAKLMRSETVPRKHSLKGNSSILSELVGIHLDVFWHSMPP